MLASRWSEGICLATFCTELLVCIHVGQVVHLGELLVCIYLELFDYKSVTQLPSATQDRLLLPWL